MSFSNPPQMKRSMSWQSNAHVSSPPTHSVGDLVNLHIQHIAFVSIHSTFSGIANIKIINAILNYSAFGILPNIQIYVLL